MTPSPKITVVADRAVQSGPLRLTLAGGSCVGNRYAANFDVLHVDDRLAFIAVVDGMGDGAGSAAAGRTTMDVVVPGVRRAAVEPGGLVGAATLRGVVAEAQRQVIAAGAELGMLTGCTLTALVGDAESAWIVQLGDSRAYRRRAGLLELLTVDHTMAWLGAVNGWYPPDSPAALAARYQLTRYLGHHGAPEPDLLAVTLRAGDTYCLVTDGVAEQVDHHRLDTWLTSAAPPGEIAAGVLADTLAAGGDDDATIAVLRVAAA